jgi:hypothetical protein
MIGAILKEADLTGADLTGADLTGADLTRADLVDVLWSGKTIWPDGLAESILARSEEREPGVWHIVGPGSASQGPQSRCRPDDTLALRLYWCRWRR